MIKAFNAKTPYKGETRILKSFKHLRLRVHKRWIGWGSVGGLGSRREALAADMRQVSGQQVENGLLGGYKKTGFTVVNPRGSRMGRALAG